MEDSRGLGIIGVGKHGRRHVHEMLGLGLQVDAGDPSMDPDELKDTFGNPPELHPHKLAVEAFLRETRASAVVIATPGATHFDVARQALSAGKDVLLEKPFTPTAEEARALIQLARERDLILMVGHNRLYLPHIRKLREIIQAGELGEIEEVTAHYLNPPQKFDHTHTALEGLGYHLLYMVSDLLGTNTPTEITTIVSSETKETVGIKLLFGKVPVTLMMSREHSGEKTRDVIVKGSKLTATFDFTKEASGTEVRLTPSLTEDDPDNTEHDERIHGLSQGFELSGDDLKPSLHHQLKVFLEAIRTRSSTPSDGSEALPIVETLEGLRANVASAVAGVYYPSARNHPELLKDLCEQIRNRVGCRGGVVTLDGQSGTGKTTLSNELKAVYECMYPGQRFQFLPFDELRRPWSICELLKRIALGQEINPTEKRTICEVLRTDLTPAQEFAGEKHLWRLDDFQRELEILKRFQLSREDSMTLHREGSYVRTFGDAIPPKDKYYRFKKNDVVLVEGKFVNVDETEGLSDMSIRVDADPGDIRRRFEEKRSTFMPPEALLLHMKYYDRVNAPSWQAYHQSTSQRIQRTIRI